MLSNKTGKPLLITDEQTGNVAGNAETGNVQANETAISSNDSSLNERTTLDPNTGQQIGDAISGTIKVANKIEAEDTNRLNDFDFSDQQINECQKMTVSY